MAHINRRTFLTTSAAAIPVVGLPGACAGQDAHRAQHNPQERNNMADASRPRAISSANGIPAVTEAMKRMRAGSSATDAVVEGVVLVENDPNDHSVGYGGLPNENGVVQLDASVMDGPMHKAGAVAALERIRNPSRVALKVLRETDHVMIVGAGALQFAKSQGFEETELLTDEAREFWLRWKRNLNPNDDWLDDDQRIDGNRESGAGPRNSDDDKRALSPDVPFTWGTIHCSAVDANGDLGATTTTSGLSWKIPGRVGDSPIIGAGMYVQNEVGSAGATGRGESVIQSCAAFQVVQHMANGDDPTEACLKVMKWIADHTRRHDLLDERGRPNFDVKLYALRKDGAFGSAVMRHRKDRGTAKFAVHDGAEARLMTCTPLYE